MSTKPPMTKNTRTRTHKSNAIESTKAMTLLKRMCPNRIRPAELHMHTYVGKRDNRIGFIH